MPLPTPNKGESQSDFISRCMENKTIKKDFPDKDQRLAVCHSQFRSKRNNVFNIITAEIGVIRTETFDDTEHTVIPVVAMVEGVRRAANSPGPELALSSEFGRFPVAWNGRPVTIDHPQVRGEMVSANVPSVLEDVQVGHVFNPVVEEGKLKLEAWVNEDRLDEKEIDILNKIKNNEVTEVSIGVFVEVEPIEGTFNGQKFNGIWRNIIPDHLALLSEGKVGACSIEDGCGTGRFAECECNAPSTFVKVLEKLRGLFKLRGAKDLSDFDTRAAIQASLESLDEWGFVVAVFENTFIMETGDGTFRRSFSISDDGTVTIGEEKEIVRPETSFVKVKTEKKDMDKEKRIDALIANEGTKFTNDHKEWLLTLEETQLDLLEVAPIDEPKKELKVEKAAEKAQEERQIEEPMTFEQYIEKAPKEIQEILRSNLAQAEKVRKEHVAVIKANAKNKFTDEQLAGMNMDMIANLAELSAVDDFSGRGGPRQNNQNTESEHHAPTPRQLFAKAG